MKSKTLKKVAGALGVAFFLAASPLATDSAYAARDTEPRSCTKNGRVYNPQFSSIVVDTRTGNILSGDRIDERRYPASMTKMMTAALIFEALRDGRLKLSDDMTLKLSNDIKATRSNSRSTWLAEGTKITVEEALLAITVASANNVSVLMAEELAGTESGFAGLMNKKAQDIGMDNTVFKNASGLPDKGQFSTARDMAKLAFYLQKKFPEYYHYFSKEKAEFGLWRGNKAKHSHNELAVKNGNIDGIKTGFICDSGYNLAASATNDNDRIITVVFGGRTPHQRNVQTKRLIEEAFPRAVAGKEGDAEMSLVMKKLPVPVFVR